MITVKHPSGEVTYHSYAIASGASPIGTGRPLPDDATLELTNGALLITVDETKPTFVWPWGKITELELGPVVEAERVMLRESDNEEIPF